MVWRPITKETCWCQENHPMGSACGCWNCDECGRFYPCITLSPEELLKSSEIIQFNSLPLSGSDIKWDSSILEWKDPGLLISLDAIEEIRNWLPGKEDTRAVFKEENLDGY